jgi:hypothetical protein
MKFLIKTSAVAVSDTKCANQGMYETSDEKEIERLKKVAKKYPEDVEFVTDKKGNKDKDDPEKKDDQDPKDDKDENEPETKDIKDPKAEGKSNKKDKK